MIWRGRFLFFHGSSLSRLFLIIGLDKTSNPPHPPPLCFLLPALKRPMRLDMGRGGVDSSHSFPVRCPGRRLSSLNKSQQNSISYSPTKDQRDSASYSHSPNETQCTLPSWGILHDLFSFSVPSFGLVVFPREDSDTGKEEEEMIKSPHQACLLPYADACTYRLWLALSNCIHRVSAHFYVIVPINRHGIAIRFYVFWVDIRFHRHAPSGRT